ncbi:hypothetical protein DPMN_057056 [Dreissena polymorpha]|uniref:Uncharacterized protein n=1 Tax=Dreissena polymorpha TaxID=45954 RepID=A0A9D4HU27_DREPO|nr:hypothetical protein DPMN_057056 [Dreissena polymorpha]
MTKHLFPFKFNFRLAQTLNGRAGIAPPMYLLIRLLSDEANVALRNVQLVTELQLTRYQRRQQKTMQGQIASVVIVQAGRGIRNGTTETDEHKVQALCLKRRIKQMSTNYKHCA